MNDGSEPGPLGVLAALPAAPAGDRPAVFDPLTGVSWTFTEVVAAAAEAAATIATADPGGDCERVAIEAPGSAAFVAALFGVWQAGRVAVPVNPRLTPGERRAHVERAGATLALTPTPAGTWTASRVPSPASSPADRDRSAGDIALVLTTSGTTGAPKPVELSHANVLNGIDTVLRSLRGPDAAPGPDPDRPPVPNLVPVPLCLWAGIYQVLFAFRAGNPVVLLDPFTTAGFAAAVRDHGIKSTVLAPAMMTALNDDPTVTDLAPLRMVRSITAPLSVHQARRFHERFGVTVLNAYGQTELGGEVIGWTAADTRAFGATKLGAVGRPHPGVSAYILEPDEGGQGELCVRAPSMITPDHDPALADRTRPDGHLRTGDIARIDDDGFVWITGRVSDLINRGGMKVWPDDVEEVLRRHPAVADAAVVGAPDERLGQVPWAFVVPADPSSPPSPEVLDAHCRDALAAYKVPVRYETIAALPRNDVGKVVRRDLLPTAPAGPPDPGAPT